MTEKLERRRRIGAVIAILSGMAIAVLMSNDAWEAVTTQSQTSAKEPVGSAAQMLTTIPIKGRAPKTGYERTQFGDGWATKEGCDTRNIILHRDLAKVAIDPECRVLSGTLDDPYTGKTIQFKRGADTSADIQIDHVVALSDAWQKGAQQLTPEKRKQLANDPLELLAVDGPANQEKSDGDAATWLPSNKAFRCQYVARQIAVKAKYELWMTPVEHDVTQKLLDNCPGQPLPTA